MVNMIGYDQNQMKMINNYIIERMKDIREKIIAFIKLRNILSDKFTRMYHDTWCYGICEKSIEMDTFGL